MLSKKSLIQHIVAVLIIILVNVVYFFPQLEGKRIVQGDIVSNSQANKALGEYQEKNNKTYLWNPGQFGGMPRLSGAPSKNNLVYKMYNVLRIGFMEPIGLFIAGSIMAYLMFVLLGVNTWLSLIFALAMVLSTSNLILWEAGHNSKIRTLIFTPILIAGVLNIFEYRKYFLGFILLALGFSFSFYTRHPQMTYYILLVFMIYGIVVIIQIIKSKDWQHLLKGALLVLIAILLGASTSMSKLWSLYDYAEVTMRGEAILKTENTNSPSSSSTVDGLAWDYAMQWSNEYKDIVATFIPGFVGGGSQENVSQKSQSFKKYNLKQAPLYWGDLPFTVGPMYLGSSLLFLFLFGLFVLKGNLKWWLGFGLLFMILLSMGKNFEILNYALFEFFPFYSKFRAPQSVLNITPFFLGILGALSLDKLFKTKFKSKKSKKENERKFIKSLYIATGICGGLALIISVLGSSLFDFSGQADARYAQQGVDLSDFIQDRKSLMQKDAIRSLIIVGLIAGLIYLFIKQKINKYVAIAGIGIIVMGDMLGIDWRYLNHSNFSTKRTYDQNFSKRTVDTGILNFEKERSNYRVHDLTINSFNSSQASEFHNTIGGYHPAKMQRMQDLIDRHISKNNIQVFNMLNTKYFIVPGPDNKAEVQVNPGALGVAWFVGNIHNVSAPIEEIEALNTINTGNTAVVLESEFGTYLQGLKDGLDSTATISMISYEPDKISYSSNSKMEMLAVFSEMWYGPDKGIQAYLDGKPVDHIRANYVLRAMKIPPGKHEILFEFRPSSYYAGEKISLAASILLIIIILSFIYYEFNRQKKSIKSNVQKRSKPN